MDTIGNRVKELRKKTHLTQDKLGHIIGLHGTNVGRIEKNEVFPTADIILNLSNYFKVSCDWLITGKQFNENQICDFADSAQFINLFLQLSDYNQDEIIHLIEYKLEKERMKELSINKPEINDEFEF